MLGFMQGRLVPAVQNKIQAFPEKDWEREFYLGEELGLRLMEWTLDDYNLEINPFLTAIGQKRIKSLSDKFGVSVSSVTGDCFMQKPFWNCDEDEQSILLKKFEKICDACSAQGVVNIIVPLVDNGALETMEQQKKLTNILLGYQRYLEDRNLCILFESDFPPLRLRAFIEDFPESCFGINYDLGNSASLGLNPTEEFALYGKRINNVHIKDRGFAGTTVPLGSGDVDFDLVFRKLVELNYNGNFIMQTARSETGDDVGVMQEYMSYISGWLPGNCSDS